MPALPENPLVGFLSWNILTYGERPDRNAACCDNRSGLWRARGGEKARLQRCAHNRDRSHELPSFSAATLSGRNGGAIAGGHCSARACCVEQMQECRGDPCRGAIGGC